MDDLSLSLSTRSCSQCAFTLKEGQRFCGRCGQEIRAQRALSVTRPPRPEVIAARMARYSVGRSPRELRLELAAALVPTGRHDEAIDALEQALEEQGSTPPAVDILF